MITVVIAYDAYIIAYSSIALCWANIWILVSSLPLGFLLKTSMSGGGRGVGVEGPLCPSRRFLDSGIKPDGKGIETSSSGVFRPMAEAAGESSKKGF